MDKLMKEQIISLRRWTEFPPYSCKLVLSCFYYSSAMDLIHSLLSFTLMNPIGWKMRSKLWPTKYPLLHSDVTFEQSEDIVIATGVVGLGIPKEGDLVA
jgi:hypothetical protein